MIENSARLTMSNHLDPQRATVAKCFDLDEAVSWKMALEATGIEAFIPEARATNSASDPLSDQFVFLVQVAAQDEMKARGLLSSTWEGQN